MDERLKNRGERIAEWDLKRARTKKTARETYSGRVKEGLE